MKINLKLLPLLGLILLTQYQNCGGVRQLSALESSQSDSAVVYAPESGSETDTSVSEVKVLEANGTPTTMAAVGGDVTRTVKTSFDYHLNFGSIAGSMVSPLNSAVGKFVRNSGCDSVPANAYRCGEVPVGAVSDGDRKLMTTLNLGHKFAGKDGKKSYNFSSKTDSDILMRIYLNRNQKGGSQNLFYLPSQKQELVRTSNKLGENIFFTLLPRGTYFDSQICTIIPGLSIELDDIKLSGEVKKADALPFGIDAKAKGDVIIHPGRMTFANAYVCGTLRVQFKKGVPYVGLEDLSEIRFQAASYEGLKIEKKIKVSGLLGFFDDLFNLGINDQFKKAIQTEVTKLVNKEVRLTSAQVQNGSYLKEYFDQAKLAPYIDKMNEEIQKAFADNGFISEQADRVTQAACVSAFAPLNLPNQALTDLVRMCSFNPQVQITGMYAGKDSSLDCYRGFFDPRAGNSLGGTDWWKNSCKVILRTEVTMNGAMLPAIACLTDALKQKALPAVHCQSFFAELAQRYSQGEFTALLNALMRTRLNDAQVAEIQAMLNSQFNTKELSASVLKKIFQ